MHLANVTYTVGGREVGGCLKQTPRIVPFAQRPRRTRCEGTTMIVTELLAEDSLQLRLHTPSSPQRLARRITWCAPTEIMDPTPFLSPNVLLLTNGIGLNFEDDRTWDAYVERLAKVPVAAIAFGTGTAHRLLPRGLVKACISHDVPLLEIPQPVPFLQVHRHVSNMLQAEHFATATQSWELANACARLTASGSTLRKILAEVAKAAGGPLAIFDAGGSVIARWPDASSWSEKDLQETAMGDEETTVPLPMGAGDSFYLVVRRNGGGQPLAALLAPAASIIAVQLKSALQTASRKEAQLETLLLQVSDWQGVALNEFTRTFSSTGLNMALPTFIFVAGVPEGNLSGVWRVRLVLQEAFSQLKVIVRDGMLVAFAQQPAEDSPYASGEKSVVASLLETFRAVAPSQALVLKGPSESVDELRLNIFHARKLVNEIRQPTVAPELSIDSLLAATAGRGARAAARKLLAPVITYDVEHSGNLLKTLRAYLENDGQPSRACQTLFIHRNTLGYRIRKLESLLDLRLDTLEGQSTSLMALRIYE